MRALVIQHGQDEPAGHVSAWLAARGARQDVLRIDLDGSARDPEAYDLIVSLGSDRSAYDDRVAWVPRERRLLEGAVRADVPVLGICFGSQLLARAAGGEATRAPHAEIGWLAVTAQDGALIEPGPWLQWHYDTFTVPPGGRLLAESPAGPQAFTIGRSLGVQFHPEVTPEIVAKWVEGGGEALAREGIDRERLLAETHEWDAENRRRAWRLLDVFAERVARL